MKFFVTGANGQLGHDVMNELNKHGHEGVGSDITPAYAGIADGFAVIEMPYIGLDITDKEAVDKIISEIKLHAVVHCAAWTAVAILWKLITRETWKRLELTLSSFGIISL